MIGERRRFGFFEQREPELFVAELRLVVKLGDGGVDGGVRRVLAGDQLERRCAVLGRACPIPLQRELEQRAVELGVVAGSDRLQLVTQLRDVALLVAGSRSASGFWRSSAMRAMR